MAEKNTKSPQTNEIPKIQTDQDLQVAFSKTRTSAYKMASEMATRCGAEVAIIIETKNKRIHSFGHPNVQKVVDRYLSQNSEPADHIEQIIEANRASRVEQLKEEFARLDMIKHEQKKHGQELKALLDGEENFFTPIEELDVQEVEGNINVVKELINMLREAASNDALKDDANASSSTHDP